MVEGVCISQDREMLRSVGYIGLNLGLNSLDLRNRRDNAEAGKL